MGLLQRDAVPPYSAFNFLGLNEPTRILPALIRLIVRRLETIHLSR
jgi:hypothetical protein